MDNYSENYDYLEDCFENSKNWEPMNMDNYYSDQEYWFEEDD